MYKWSLKLQYPSCFSHAVHHNTVEPRAVCPQPILWIPRIGRAACSWPCCQLEKVDKLLNSHKAKTATSYKLALKTHYLTATTPAPCREHSVSGKGVIFTAVSSVQSQPTWQSVSLLIGLILGSLLQDFIVRIVIHVTDVTLYCATSCSKAFSVLYMLP